jgi:hypothetical protein
MTPEAYANAYSTPTQGQHSAAESGTTISSHTLYQKPHPFCPPSSQLDLHRPDAQFRSFDATAHNQARPDDASWYASVPPELRARPQWVLWRYGPRRKDGKRPKLPYSTGTRRAADTTDPASWGSFDQAAAALASNRYFDGIGFVFGPDDPFTGVDLDGCIDAEGKIAPWAYQVLDQLPGAYVELSPSGTGVHAIVRAQLPGPGRRRGQLECYDRERYFTITGRAMVEPGPIADAQAAITELYTSLGGSSVAASATGVTTTSALDWGFVAWLENHIRRLVSPEGLPYGATPQLRALLSRDELPPNLRAKGDSASERRALVVHQLARAGHLPEEIYLLARHLWARYGYESNKRPQDLDTDVLRLLSVAQVDPARYSPHSLARFADYRHDPQRPASSPPAAPAARQPARRAVCTPDAYLAALSDIATASGVILATREERAQASGVSAKTAQRLESKLQAAGTLQLELYTLAASDGRRTRASRITITKGADVHTGISIFSPGSADVHTIPEETADSSSTPESPAETGVCIGEYTVCDPPPSPRAPDPAPAPAPAPAADRQHNPPVFSPCPAPRPLAELVAEALDAYGTAGGKASRHRVAAHVRTVGGLKVSEGAITRVYVAELARRKRARADQALRGKAEAMGTAQRGARLRSLERNIVADLKLAAELRARPYVLDIDGQITTERRSPKTPAALVARAWVWAKQYAIIAQVHEERLAQLLTPEAEEAHLLAEADAVIERLRKAGELPANKPRVNLNPTPASQPARISYDVAGMVRRLEAWNRQLAISATNSCCG